MQSREDGEGRGGGAIQLLALGRIDVRTPDGAPIESILAQEKRLALLAYLTLATPRGRHRRDTLLGLFWPELDQRRARAALRQLLHYLRGELGEDALVGSGTQEVGVDPDRVRSDVEAFEAALAAERREAALELYGGDLLRGFYVSGVSPAFEHWLDGERDRLRGLAEEAAWALTEDAAERGDRRAAARWGRRALALAPHSESSLRRLLASLNSLDAVPEALAVYDEFARQFHDVFDARPSEKTRQLVEEIRGRLEPGVPASVSPGADEGRPSDEAGVVSRPPPPESSGTAMTRVDAIGVAAEESGLAGSWWWAGGALVILVLGLVGWGAWRTTRPLEVAPDPGVVAVFPFEVEAADPAVAFLGQGMAELLAARVWGDAPLQALSPAELSDRATRSAGIGTVEDLALDRRAGVARAAGAGRMIEGRVVGTARALIISAAVARTGTGSPEARVSVSGPLDSLPVLVDRIAAALLIGSAGEDAASLAGTPLPALNSYLRGRAAYRAGRYDRAVRLYRDALDQDSTFVHAAVGLASATRSLAGFQRDGAVEVALEERDRLPTSKRDFVDALVGSGFQQPLASQLGAWERAVEAMPHQPDTWYWLGDLLSRHGSTMGLGAGRERAVGVLRRAIEIDSTYIPALTLLIDLAVATGDRTRVDTLYRRYLRLEPTAAYRAYIDWRVAELRGRDARLEAIEAGFPDLPAHTLLEILGTAQLDAMGLARADRAAAALRSQANPRPVQWASDHLLHHYALNRGRIEEAARLTRLAGDLFPGSTRHLQMRVLDALYSEGDTTAAAQAAAALERAVGQDTAASRDALDALCVLYQWKLNAGETAGARRAIERLHAAAANDGNGARPHPCAPVLNLLLDRAEGRRISAERLGALGRRQAARVASWESSHVVNLIVARTHERQGNLPAALAALQRRPYHYALGPAYLSTFLREQARLAGRLDESETARGASDHLRALRAR